MYTKTINIKFKKVIIPVVLLFTTDDGNEMTISINAMVNEYLLIQEVKFNTRDEAYDFIKHYPKSMAMSFIVREAYNTEAIH